MADNKFEAKLGLDNKEFKSKLKDSEGSVGKFGGAISKLGAVMAGVFSVGLLIDFGKQAIQLASQIEGVRTAFQRLAAPGLLEGLRLATRGTVTDLQLMQKAVQANNFKIPLSELATYFEFATKRAIQTGESVDYLVDSIITGIGRKSVLVMDNLGISAVELQKEIERTGDFATAASVIVQRGLAEMGDVADTTATKIASISTALTNLKTGIGTKITESPIFQGLTTWINNIGKFAQVPGMTLPQAIYGATFRADEFNKTLDESNKLIAENAKVLQKQKEQLAAISQLKGLKKIQEPINEVSKFPTLKGLPGFKPGAPDVISEYGGSPGDMIKEFSDMQTALMDLSATFSTFFSDVNLGFQGMVDGVITGLKRLVMELIAKSAILALLSVITGVPLSGAMFKKLLFGNFSSMIGGGTGIGGSGWKSSGNIQQSITLQGVLKGKDIYLSNQRFVNELNVGT